MHINAYIVALSALSIFCNSSVYTADLAFSTPPAIPLSEAATVYLPKPQGRQGAVEPRRLNFNQEARPVKVEVKMPVAIRPFILYRMEEYVRKEEKSPQKYWDQVVEICQSSQGYGEWALYCAVTQNAPKVLKRLLEARYNALQLFPAEFNMNTTKARDILRGAQKEAEGCSSLITFEQEKETALESLLDIALRMAHKEVSTILIHVIPLWLLQQNGASPLRTALEKGHAEMVAFVITQINQNHEENRLLLEELLPLAKAHEDEKLITLLNTKLGIHETEVVQQAEATLAKPAEGNLFASVKALLMSLAVKKTVSSILKAAPFIGFGILYCMALKNRFEENLCASLLKSATSWPHNYAHSHD